MRFAYGGATATLMDLGSQRYSLSSVFSNYLGKGDARGLLQKITTFVDERDASISLIVQRYHYTRPPAMDNQQLIEFYSKFGFQLDPYYGDGSIKKMVRPALSDRVAS